MATEQEQLAALDQELKTLRADYNQAIRNLVALQVGDRDDQVAAFDAYHAAGLAYFNAHERAIPLDARLNMDLNSTCYTDRSETSANVLDVVATHYVTLRMWADDLGIDMEHLRPSRTSFANMQRRVRETQPEDADQLRERFVSLGLPTRGFDAVESRSAREVPPSPHTTNIYGPATGCAIGPGARVDAGSINHNQIGEQVMGDKINIGGNVTGSAVGSHASVKARDIVTQIQQSGVLGDDIGQAFAKAAEELDKLKLGEGDKDDVVGELEKLKKELEKQTKDEKRIKTIWDRINGLASTVASALSAAASIGKIVLGGA